MNKTIKFILGFCIGIVVVSLLFGFISDSPEVENFEIGDELVTYEANNLKIPVGITEQSLKDWIEASEDQRNALIISKQIFPLMSGVRIKNLGKSSVGIIHIIVLDGPYQDSDGYMTVESARTIK